MADHPRGGAAHPQGIFECVWLLPSGRRCGYAQRGPGMCPYAHPEPQRIVPFACPSCGHASEEADRAA